MMLNSSVGARSTWNPYQNLLHTHTHKIRPHIQIPKADIIILMTAIQVWMF